MVRKMAYIGFSFIAGMFFASFFSLYIAAAVFGVFAAISAAFFAVKHKKRPHKADGQIVMTLAVCLISASVGALRYSIHNTNVYNKTVAFDGQQVSVSGKITECKVLSSGTAIYTVKGKINGGVKATVSFFSDNSSYEISDRADVTGICRRLENSWKFPEKSYYKPKGIYVKLTDITAENFTVNNKFSLQKTLCFYRDSICGKIKNALAEREAAVVLAMVFGEKSGLDDFDKLCFYRSGIGHIMAVSGTHMVLIAGFAIALLSFLPLGSVERFVLLIFVITPFAVMSGLTPSVIRSAVMIFIVYSGTALGRQSDTLNSLGIAALILAGNNPFCIRDPSFLMSFAGVIGISVIAPAISKAVDEIFKTDKTFDFLIAPLGAAIAVYPASVFFFDELSVVSPIVQILLMPICTLILFCGFAFMVTGGTIGVFLLPAGSAAHIVLNVCRFFGTKQWSYLPLQGNLPKIMAAIIIISAAVVGFMKGRSAAAWTSAAMFAVMLTALSVDRMNLSDRVTVAVIGDTKSSVCIVHDGYKAIVIDLNYGEKCASAAADYLYGYGIGTVDMLVLPRGAYSQDKAFTEGFEHFDTGMVAVPKGRLADEGTFKIIPSEFSYGSTELDNDFAAVMPISKTDIAVKLNGITLFLTEDPQLADSFTEYPDILICYGKNDDELENEQIVYSENRLYLSDENALYGVNAEYFTYPDGRILTEVISFGGSY